MLSKALLVSFMLPMMARAADQVELASDRDGNETKAFAYTVPKRTLERQPLWEPGTRPCPLPLETATRVALSWLEHQTWKRSVHLRNISLTRNTKYGIGTWYYSFLFDDRVLNETPSPGGVIRAKHPSSIVILLDGTLVKPTNVRGRPKN